MSSPLTFVDLFGVPHVEPSVSGLVEVQTVESPRPGAYTDLVVLSPFGSGEPFRLRRFRSLASLTAYHDPDRVGDEGVALCRVAKAPFGDVNVFGAADILTVRVNRADRASAVLVGGGQQLVRIWSSDWGMRGNSSTAVVGLGTTTGRRVSLSDGQRTYVGDNLGPLFTVQYIGAGTQCVMTVRRAQARISYVGNPSEGGSITINGVRFEFRVSGSGQPGSVVVPIGATPADTYAAFAAAVSEHVPGVRALASPDDAVVELEAPEEGLRVTSSYLIGQQLLSYGRTVALTTSVSGASGEDLFLRFTVPAMATVGALVDAINRFAPAGSGPVYRATLLPTADRFLPSTEIDPVVEQPIRADAYTVTGFAGAITQFVNTRTRGQFAAERLGYGTPDTGRVVFAGGTMRVPTIADWDRALEVVATNIEFGAKVLVNTSDAAVLALVGQWIQEQRALGKWFQAFAGLAEGYSTQYGDDEAVRRYTQVAAALDSTRMVVTCQRVAVFGEQNTLRYLPPVFLAAALAGGAAGNRPYVQPLTNKRLRFAGLHPDDAWDVTVREKLLLGGVTVAKTDNDRLVVALAVTTSQDPDKRMARILSEISTVDMIDADVRLALLPWRGKWSTLNVEAMAISVLTQVLSRYVREGALTSGVDTQGQRVPAFRLGRPAAVIEGGVMTMEYQVFIGGELNHVSLHGTAEYQRLVGEMQGGATTMSTVVPIR